MHPAGSYCRNIPRCTVNKTLFFQLWHCEHACKNEPAKTRLTQAWMQHSPPASLSLYHNHLLCPRSRPTLQCVVQYRKKCVIKRIRSSHNSNSRCKFDPQLGGVFASSMWEMEKLIKRNSLQWWRKQRQVYGWNVITEEKLDDTVSFLERSPRKSLNTFNCTIWLFTGTSSHSNKTSEIVAL